MQRVGFICILLTLMVPFPGRGAWSAPGTDKNILKSIATRIAKPITQRIKEKQNKLDEAIRKGKKNRNKTHKKSASSSNKVQSEGVPPHSENSPELLQFNPDKPTKNPKYFFEFARSEIMNVVRAISSMTQKNFIVPDELKSRRITILSPTPITVAEAYNVFLAALEINGITVVKSTGKFLKLVESKDAMKTQIPTCIGPEEICPKTTERMVTRLIYLQNVEAKQITTILTSLMSDGGHLNTFEPTNALIISEYAPNLNRLTKIIKALDVPGFFEHELKLVPIKYAIASEIAEKLRSIFDVRHEITFSPMDKNSQLKEGERPPPEMDTPAYEQPPLERINGSADIDGDIQVSKIISDDRSNQLIIKANEKSFASIQKLISKLDIPISDVEPGGVHIYHLENAHADDLWKTLSALVDQNTIDSKASQNSNGRESNRSSLFQSEISITFNLSTNSLIIIANSQDYTALTSIIELLDKTPKGSELEVHVYQLKKANAKEVSTTLTAMINGDSGNLLATPNQSAGSNKIRSAGTLFKSDISITCNPSSNSLIVIASELDYRSLTDIIELLDSPPNKTQYTINVYQLQNANANDLAGTLRALVTGPLSNTVTSSHSNNMDSSTSSHGNLFKGEITITPDPPTNSLIIVSSPEDYAALTKTLDILDRPTLQKKCPVGVRAIVASDKADDTFAIIELEGSTSIIHIGSQITHDKSAYRVSSIESDSLTLKRGNAEIKCYLDG